MDRNRPANGENENSNGRILPAALPGLNVGDGVERLGGDQDLYLEMVREYAADWRDFAATFRERVVCGDFPTARRAAHSLKGTGGNISAPDLYAAARELEQACMDGQTDRILEKLVPVEQALAAVTSSVQRLAAAMDSTANDRAPAARTDHDPDQLRRLFHGLSESLSASDPVQSGSYLEKIKAGAVPAAMREDLQYLDERMRQYDFAVAANLLQQMIRKLAD